LILKSKELTNNRKIPSEFTVTVETSLLSSCGKTFLMEQRALQKASQIQLFRGGGSWLHWLFFGTSADARQIERSSLFDGAEEIVNDFGE